MNKNIIIAILVVIIIAIGAAFVVGQSNGKTNTQLNIINNETFQEGEHVHIELKDDQGKALSGKNLEITFNNQKYTVTTDQDGRCYLTINGVASGKYDVEAKFAGDDKYNGCDAKASITIDTGSEANNIAEPTVGSATTASSTGNSSSKNSASGWTYYAQWNCWVDENGIVVRIGDGKNCEQSCIGLPYETAVLVWTGKLVPSDLADDNDTGNLPLNDTSNN